jgi:hypothetical protein
MDFFFSQWLVYKKRIPLAVGWKYNEHKSKITYSESPNGLSTDILRVFTSVTYPGHFYPDLTFQIVRIRILPFINFAPFCQQEIFFITMPITTYLWYKRYHLCISMKSSYLSAQKMVIISQFFQPRIRSQTSGSGSGHKGSDQTGSGSAKLFFLPRWVPKVRSCFPAS